MIPPDPSGPKPQRIQRKRTRGWKMPPNTVYVGRPTKWGNPYKVKIGETPAAAVQRFRDYIEHDARRRFEMGVELRGKNLACWCKEGAPCHADVLLELANV